MSPEVTCASALPDKTGKHENCIFTQMPEFNQSLLDFFNLFDTRLLLTLLLPISCNQWVQLHAVGGMVQEKGSQERSSSWTVLHAQCTSALSSWFPLSPSNAEALDRWGGKTKHRLILCFLGNTSAKNYRKFVIGCCSLCQDYSKSKAGRFLRHSIFIVACK